MDGWHCKKERHFRLRSRNSMMIWIRPTLCRPIGSKRKLPKVKLRCTKENAAAAILSQHLLIRWHQSSFTLPRAFRPKKDGFIHIFSTILQQKAETYKKFGMWFEYLYIYAIFILNINHKKKVCTVRARVRVTFAGRLQVAGA